MSRRRSTGDLVPRDISEILAREARAQRGQKKSGGSLGQAFGWLKGNRKKKGVSNGLRHMGVGVMDAKVGFQNHEHAKGGSQEASLVSELCDEEERLQRITKTLSTVRGLLGMGNSIQTKKKVQTEANPPARSSSSTRQGKRKSSWLFGRRDKVKTAVVLSILAFTVAISSSPVTSCPDVLRLRVSPFSSSPCLAVCNYGRIAGLKGTEDQKRLAVHYSASQHHLENVFIQGSRPQYLEDLHSEAQEGLKILQQEGPTTSHRKLRIRYTLRPEQEVSSKDRVCSAESRSIAGNTDVTTASARPVLTRQGSTFKPLNSVKRSDKNKKRNRRTTIMGIPNQVQKELGINKRYPVIVCLLCVLILMLAVNFPVSSTAQKLSESCFYSAPRSR
ncbi:unnamed protein product [Tetraodon nigroviridis]|uniref:(spotted green pufferfish) hypothetical protein n=1 Tax=Tetraodon nigroviridis TaxID=99883 RepID=Q4SIR7_TETNG|nr:unnamed protein product [Tetraodon nigroviridis]